MFYLFDYHPSSFLPKAYHQVHFRICDNHVPIYFYENCQTVFGIQFSWCSNENLFRWYLLRIKAVDFNRPSYFLISDIRRLLIYFYVYLSSLSIPSLVIATIIFSPCNSHAKLHIRRPCVWADGYVHIHLFERTFQHCKTPLGHFTKRYSPPGRRKSSEPQPLGWPSVPSLFDWWISTVISRVGRGAFGPAHLLCLRSARITISRSFSQLREERKTWGRRFGAWSWSSSWSRRFQI